MGCVGSKDGSEGNEKHPNVFRVVNVNYDGDDLWTGHIEVTSTNLTLYRKRKPPTQWPLQCLRRYGYENDTFIFEAGRRCLTGEGIYSFQCGRAEALFHVLQDYIQESTYNNNNNMTVSDDMQMAQERMEADVAELRRGLSHQTSGSNYIILHGSNTVNSGGGSGGTTTQLSHQSPARPGSPPRNSCSPHEPSSNNNYLEPLSGGTPQSPLSAGNPSSSNIYTNSIMMGNVYQQLALAQSSPGTTAGTVDNSPAETNTPGSSAGTAGRPTTSHSLMRIRSIMSSEDVGGSATVGGVGSTASSPIALEDGGQPSLNTYMNVTPGEMVLLSSINTAGTTNSSISTAGWRFSRMNSNASSSTERCYENLDPVILASLNGQAQQQQLINSSSSHAIANGIRSGRHSRPDIFSKVDLPMTAGLDGALRMSEPCTPTVGPSSSLALQNAQRKVNYIVLDLDNQSGVSLASTSAAGIGTTTATTTPSVSSSSTGGGGTPISNLLVPESPKRQTMGYATIDFNKTVALSNSTNPTCESEASRRTRF